MNNEAFHVQVCIPSDGFWRAEMGYSLALMVSYTEARKPKGSAISVARVETSTISGARQMLVKKALQNSASHVLFLDSDMVFPANTLEQLLSHRLPVVAANCTTRVEPIVPVAYDFEGNRIHSLGKTGLQKVRQVGLAVALISTDVFRKTRPPHFLQDWIPNNLNYCGEDVYCCQVLQAGGFDVWIDHDLSQKIGHVGSRTYTHKDTKDEQPERKGA